LTVLFILAARAGQKAKPEAAVLFMPMRSKPVLFYPLSLFGPVQVPGNIGDKLNRVGLGFS
jgi:hypothetical protein